MEIDLDRTKAVIFDLDGTLYDSHLLPLHLILSDLRHIKLLHAERKVRKEMSGWADLKTGMEVYGNLFMRIREVTGRSLDEITHWYDDCYMPLMVRVLERHYHARPGVEALFAGLRKAGVKIAVFSDYGSVEAKLKALQISPSWVDLIIDAPTLGGFKPNKASFVRLLERLGVTAGEALMVGDRCDTDGCGATSAGIPFILLREGKKKDMPADGQAYPIMSWSELQAFISRRQELSATGCE